MPGAIPHIHSSTTRWIG